MQTRLLDESPAFVPLPLSIFSPFFNNKSCYALYSVQDVQNAMALQPSIPVIKRSLRRQDVTTKCCDQTSNWI